MNSGWRRIWGGTFIGPNLCAFGLQTTLLVSDQVARVRLARDQVAGDKVVELRPGYLDFTDFQAVPIHLQTFSHRRQMANGEIQNDKPASLVEAYHCPHQRILRSDNELGLRG
jgi:hypothetical protein